MLEDDWSEDHHYAEVQDEQGRVLQRARLQEGMAGITESWILRLVRAVVPGLGEPLFRCGLSRCDAAG